MAVSEKKLNTFFTRDDFGMYVIDCHFNEDGGVGCVYELQYYANSYHTLAASEYLFGDYRRIYDLLNTTSNLKLPEKKRKKRPNLDRLSKNTNNRIAIHEAKTKGKNTIFDCFTSTCRRWTDAQTSNAPYIPIYYLGHNTFLNMFLSNKALQRCIFDIYAPEFNPIRWALIAREEILNNDLTTIANQIRESLAVGPDDIIFVKSPAGTRGHNNRQVFARDLEGALDDVITGKIYVYDDPNADGLGISLEPQRPAQPQLYMLFETASGFQAENSNYQTQRLGVTHHYLTGALKVALIRTQEHPTYDSHETFDDNIKREYEKVNAFEDDRLTEFLRKLPMIHPADIIINLLDKGQKAYRLLAQEIFDQWSVATVKMIEYQLLCRYWWNRGYTSYADLFGLLQIDDEMNRIMSIYMHKDIERVQWLPNPGQQHLNKESCREYIKTCIKNVKVIPHYVADELRRQFVNSPGSMIRLHDMDTRMFEETETSSSMSSSSSSGSIKRDDNFSSHRKSSSG